MLSQKCDLHRRKTRKTISKQVKAMRLITIRSDGSFIKLVYICAMLAKRYPRKKLVIFGASSFAEIANTYFAQSDFQVVAHLVDTEYAPEDKFEIGGAPVYDINSTLGLGAISKASHFYVAVTYTQLNQLRYTKYQLLKNMGKSPASYISPLAIVDPSVKIGEHTFIFEANVIQYGARIGKNCILWSGNHVGHHSIVGDNVFVSSHVVVSGHVEIGKNSFLGVNATVYNNIKIGQDNWLSPGTIVQRNSEDNVLFKVKGTEPYPLKTREYFKLD